MSNVVERIETFNQGRDPHLIGLKYQAMRTDAFAFLRATCHLFYEDWPAQTPLNDAPASWSCGDLHWQNLGSYKGDNRLVYFQVNDFDEAVLAPCTWDLARFLVSILVSAPQLDVKETKAQKLCAYFLDAYTDELAKGRIRSIEENGTTGLVRDLLFQVRTRARKALLDSRTTLTNEGRRLIIDGKRATPANGGEKNAVARLVEEWGAKQHDPRFYHVLDVAHRIAGIGSLGVERYVVLVEGKGSPDHNFLLDLKAATPSSLQPYLTVAQPHWTDEAARVATIQRWIQGNPPALLAAVPLADKFYVLRELQPVEDKINIAPLQGKQDRLEKLLKTVAKVIAWGQVRSAGRQGAANAYDLMHFAQASHWRDSLLDYAHAYAGQVKQDYETFCKAYESGALTPQAAVAMPEPASL